MTRRTFFIAALLAGALLVAACGDDDAATITTTSGGSGADFPQEFVDSYMAGCTSEAGIEACQCTIDQFEERYTIEEFIQFATAGDENDPRVREVIEFCLRNG